MGYTVSTPIFLGSVIPRDALLIGAIELQHTFFTTTESMSTMLKGRIMFRIGVQADFSWSSPLGMNDRKEKSFISSSHDDDGSRKEGTMHYHTASFATMDGSCDSRNGVNVEATAYRRTVRNRFIYLNRQLWVIMSLSRHAPSMALHDRDDLHANGMTRGDTYF